MTKYLILILGVSSRLLWASFQLDDQYSYKGFVVGVVNATTHPVFASQVETELISLLQANPRFDFLEKNQESFRAGLSKLSAKSIQPSSNEQLKVFEDLFKDQYVRGSRGVVLAEVIKSDEADYSVNLTLATTATGEMIATETVVVNNPKALDSFALATREAMSEITQKIPFDASIVKRDGYMVVLDRGSRVFRPGTQVSVFTIENRDGKLIFEETGLIGITQVEENLTFGKVMVEKRPHEVAKGNKVQFSDSPPMEVASLLDESEGRVPASLWGNEFEVTKGKLGIVGIDFNSSLVSFSDLTQSGSQNQASRIVVGGNFNGELWLTSKYYLNLGLNYGAGTLANSSTPGVSDVGLSVSGFKFLLGYRLNIFAPSSGPIVYLRGGYGTQSFSVQTESSPSLFTSRSYSGPMISGGVSFPLDEKLSIGVDVSSLVLTSVKEGGATNNYNFSNVGAWTLLFKGTYNYQRDLDITGKFFVQRFSANLSVADSASPAGPTLVSSTQTVTGLMLGATYYY